MKPVIASSAVSTILALGLGYVMLVPIGLAGAGWAIFMGYGVATLYLAVDYFYRGTVPESGEIKETDFRSLEEPAREGER